MKKRILSVLMCLCMVTALLPTMALAAGPTGRWTDSGNYSTAWYNDTGTSFSISSAAELAGLAVLVNGGNNFSSKTVTLTADIDLAAHYWMPIGYGNRSFKGTFDGGEHSITNMFVETSEVGYVTAGLFGIMEPGGMVRNVSVSGSVSSSSDGSVSRAGGIVGYNIIGAVTDCTYVGSVSSRSRDSYTSLTSAGGVVGYNAGGTVTNCSSTGNVAASDGEDNYAGGVVGINEQNSSVTNCSHAGDVIASGGRNVNDAGGVVGYNAESTVTNCSNTGDVTASGGKFTFSGGVLGLVVGRNEHKSSVASSYNAGNIKASGGDENYAGGVAGVNGQNCTLTNCSNAGSATASGGSDSHAGGVVGLNNDALNNCYNTGSVNASGSSRSPHAGGVVGLNSHDYATTANCYWLSGTAATAVENISGTVVNCASFTDEAGALTLGGNTSETNTLTASTLLDALNAWVQEQTIPSDYLGWTVITDVNGGYPVLRPWYTAAFNANGGAVATESKAIVIGGGYGSLPTPTRSGYTFAGWFTDAAGGTPVTADTTVAITADQMLYARWHIPYVPPAVSVPVAGGSGRSMNVDVTTSGSSVIVNSPSASKLQDVISSAEAVERPVSIDLSSLGDNLDMAVLPSSLLSGVAGSDAPGLSVTMPDGKGVSFDQTALGALISAGSGHLKLGVRQVPAEFLTDAQRSLLGSAPVLDLTVFVGTTQVHGFGGGFVTVSIPVDGEPVEHPIIWRMTSDVDGKVTLEAIECIYNLETKCYVFQTDSFSEYVLGNYPFIDTPDTAWYYEDVVYTYVNGLFSGTDDTAFSPDMTMTRGMLVMVLWRMEGSPAVADAADFSDIVSSAWYADAVAWAAENEIVTGYGENKFGPEDNITREQMAVVLYRYAQYKGYDVSVGEDTNILSYEDAFDIAEYAIPSIQWACGASLMQGSDGYLMPQGDADRAQVAAILHRFNVNVSK